MNKLSISNNEVLTMSGEMINLMQGDIDKFNARGYTCVLLV